MGKKSNSFPKIPISIKGEADNSIIAYLKSLCRTSGVRYNSLKNYVSVIPSLMLTTSWCANVTSGNYKTRTPYSVCFDIAIYNLVSDIIEEVAPDIVVCSLSDDRLTIAFDNCKTLAKVHDAWNKRFSYLFSDFEDTDTILHISDEDERDVVDYWVGN